MLVLTRRAGEAIKIGEDVEVTIHGIDRGQVRIGIDAPKDVNIARTELLDQIKKVLKV
jgi:carbon storage regulator